MNKFLSRIENNLKTLLAFSENFGSLQPAMRYSVLNGGKRLRPTLVYLTGETFGASLENCDAAASAIEFIHCYSLVHDDLPAMDDDDIRRGKPTCHKAFNEATAILVGDALQALAFSTIAESNLQDSQKIRMIQILSYAAGADGMVGGQALDLAAEGHPLTLQQIEQLHRLKTSQLIKAAILMGAVAAHCPAEIYAELAKFAELLGLAFQIQDDILDIESSREILGKSTGTDVKLNKATYPAIAGVEAAKQKVQQLSNDAITILQKLPQNTTELETLTNNLISRQY